MFVHESVLLAEVIDSLSPRDHEVFVDGTLGGGGHSRALLKVCPGARIIGIDRDPMALEAASDLSPIHGQYSEIPQILAKLGIEKVDGILLDLGVSSPQLDLAERGFSFSKDGPLDMRMDPTRGQTALELIEHTDPDTLGELITELGEERHGKRVGQLIHEAVAAGQAKTTLELAKVIAKAIPIIEQRKSKIHPATRTFQALRIAVNAELDELETFLAAFPDLLAPGGRCAIISFHSLEDRLVKNRFRDLNWTSSLPERFAIQAGERVLPVVEPITKKAVFASDAEVERNPRSRSARLRAVRRTSAPNVPAKT